MIKMKKNYAILTFLRLKFSQGILTYGYRDPENNFKLNDKHKETYA